MRLEQCFCQFAIVALVAFASPATAVARISFPPPAVLAQPEAQHDKYPTVLMEPAALAEDQQRGVIYLDASGREERRVTIRDGVVYDHHGAVLPDSKNDHNDEINYVMDAAGNFYMFDEYTTPAIRHSSIFAGGPVAGAGNLRIVNGRIVYIDYHSGHYPAGRVFANVLAELAAHGVYVAALTRQ